MPTTVATAVVTGATRGLGRALALGLAERGVRLAVCGRDRPRLERLAGELGPDHSVERVDVTGPRVAAWAGRVVEGMGPPDLLVSNAGVIHRPAPLWELDPEETARVLAVNVVGVHRVAAAFLPAMIRRGSGVVVHMSSGWGRSTAPRMGAYCASKWAVEGLTGALAAELPAGLAAVALDPGVIRTAMLETSFGEAAAAHPGPEAWARRAVPFLLGLGPGDNGASLSVPDRAGPQLRGGSR